MNKSRWLDLSNRWTMSNSTMSSPGFGGSSLIFDEWEGNNYVMDVDLTATKFNNYANIGLFFYYKDENHFGRIIIIDNNQSDRFHIETEGINLKTSSKIFGNIDIDFHSKKMHHARLVRFGKDIYFYFDNNLIFMIEIEENLDGKVGLYVYGGTGHFSNFYLRPIFGKNPYNYINIVFLIIYMIFIVGPKNRNRESIVSIDNIIILCGFIFFIVGIFHGWINLIIYGTFMSGFGLMLFFSQLNKIIFRNILIHDLMILIIIFSSISYIMLLIPEWNLLLTIGTLIIYYMMVNVYKDENKGNLGIMEKWPLSNFPIFLAIINLVTAFTISMFSENKAETFANYAYYFLVFGMVVRFCELNKFGEKININYILYKIRKKVVSIVYRKRKKLKIRNNVYIFLYLILIFAILIPFLYKDMFLLDFSTKINVDNLELFYSKDAYEYGGSLLIILITEIFQKLLIFITLYIGTYSMYHFVGKMIFSRISKYYSGLLYAFNPYTYIRIITGQIFLLFSYAILPFSIKSFIELLENKERKSAIKFIFFTSLVASNIHMLIIALIIMSIIFIFWILKYRYTRNIEIIPITIIIFIFLNFYWIFPLMTAKNTAIDNINEEDYATFASDIEKNIKGWFEIVAMYGFWREGYIYAKDFIPGWQILYLIILSLAVYGLISYYRDEKIGIYVKSFAVIGIIGFILASGIKGPFSDIIYWLFDNTILKGFRDSHKFIAMLVLSYSILGGLGLSKIKYIYDNR